jgi:hypothetical protein
MSDATRIGVVLSSGGTRGVYAHAGFLLAVEEMGIPVSACAGCSAGAVVGGSERGDAAAPELTWPMTEGGPAVQAAARMQAETLLRPYLAALLSDPRQQLPVSPASRAAVGAAQEGACGDD